MVAFSSLSVALLVLWMTIQHVPSWYRPLTPDRESVHRAQIDTATLVDWISEKMVEGEQFEIILHDRSVNEWLAALPHTLPDARRSMPPGISEPIVRFDRDGILIAARCSRGGWEVIASLIIEMNIPDNEDHLSLTLRRVFGGSLPVPDMAVEAMLEPLRELNNPVYTVEPLLDAVGPEGMYLLCIFNDANEAEALARRVNSIVGHGHIGDVSRVECERALFPIGHRGVIAPHPDPVAVRILDDVPFPDGRLGQGRSGGKFRVLSEGCRTESDHYSEQRRHKTHSMRGQMMPEPSDTATISKTVEGVHCSVVFFFLFLPAFFSLGGKEDTYSCERLSHSSNTASSS